MNAVLKSALARVASFVPTAIATLITSRLVIQHYGIDAFDSFALIVALINLVPLNNLGVGAAVTAAFAREDAEPGIRTRTVITATRVLSISSAATSLTAAVLGLLGLWPALLGGASGANSWTALAVIVYALTFVPGLGTSILLGVHRNHVTVALQSFFNPLIAVFVAVAVAAGLSGSVLLVTPCLALLIVHTATSGVAARVTGLSWRRVLAAVPRPRTHPGASIRALSGPMLVITLSTPLALQSDRIVLSHVSNAQAVAEYSIAYQIFAPVLVLIAASAQPLWPIYTRARSQGERGPAIGRMLLLFGGAAAGAGGVLALLANPVASLVAAGHVQITPLLALSGALLVVTTGLAYPVAMSLMDPSGIRVALWWTVAALPLNIGLSVVLGKHLGAPGPLLASCLVGMFVQTLPGVIYSRDRHLAGRHRRARRSAPSPVLQLQLGSLELGALEQVAD